jgi:hypothetical protein
MYFTPDQIADLRVGLAAIQPKLSALRERLVLYPFQTPGAREHADHGLTRRLGTLARCIERTFELLPPDLDEIPEREQTLDAAINIQAFVVTAFGCCENIAWIWVHERGVLRPNGQPLTASHVGLGPNYPLVRNALTPRFVAYLDQRADWFEQLKDYRDALAHRIPLYIPPFTLNPNDANRYQALELDATRALRAHDFEGYERLTAERDALTRFQPIMTHSLVAQGHIVVFHYQLLADFGTIEEMVGVLFNELAYP